MTPSQLIGLVMLILAIVGLIAVWTIVVLYMRRLDRPAVAAAGAGWGTPDEVVVEREIAPDGTVVERRQETEWAGWDDRADAEDDWFAEDETLVVPAEEVTAVMPVVDGADHTTALEAENPDDGAQWAGDGDRSVDAHRGHADADELTTVVPAGGGATASLPGGSAANDRMADDRIAADRPDEDRVADDRVADDWFEDDGVAENGVAENGVAENGVAENGVAENRGVEDRVAEERLDGTDGRVDATDDRSTDEGDVGAGDDGGASGRRGTELRDGAAGSGDDEWAPHDPAPAGGDDPFAVEDQQTTTRKKRRFGF